MQSVEEPHICYKCDYETGDLLTHCPRCGHILRAARQVRRLGWVLVATGAFLVVFMSGLIILIANIMARTDEPGATTRFTGDSLDAAMIFGILGMVWVFGLTSLAGGIWQVRYARRNKKLMWIIILLGFAFMAIGQIIEFLE